MSSRPAAGVRSITPVGLYEKALPDELGWEARLRLAGEAGYDYVEMSIDESDARLARLDWTARERTELRHAIAAAGVPVHTMGLSAHRKFPLGSASAGTRAQALALLQRAIDLAAEIGVRVIQLMGYDVFYEPRDANSEARFVEGLAQGARWAASAGVMLGLENVDHDFITSVEQAMHYIRRVSSPWLQAYPDMGNLVASGYDPLAQLPLAQGHLAGVHVKDAVPGMYRGVPFETGQVPFAPVLALLARLGFWGPVTVEMWAHMDPGGDPAGAAAAACRLVTRLMAAAWADLPAGYPAADTHRKETRDDDRLPTR